MATAASLNMQNPLIRSRAAWCSPPARFTARIAFPSHTASAAATEAATIRDATGGRSGASG